MPQDIARITPETALASITATQPQRLDQNPALVYLAALEPSGRSSQRTALEAVAKMVSASPAATIVSFPWASLRYQHVQAVKAQLRETMKPATVNRYLCAVRGALHESFRLQQIGAEDYHRARDVAGIRNDVLPAGRSVSAGELAALFRSCMETEGPAGARDAAVIALLYGAGLRRGDVVGLNMSDFEEETGTLTIRSGKGRKDRTAHTTNGSHEALVAWLDVRGREPGPVPFLNPVNKAGKIARRQRLSPQAVYLILDRRAKQASVAKCSPHDMRRSFVSDLLDAGADISTVQKLAGHASVTTTQRYDRRGEAAKKKAVGLLAVPYVAKR